MLYKVLASAKSIIWSICKFTKRAFVTLPFPFDGFNGLPLKFGVIIVFVMN